MRPLPRPQPRWLLRPRRPRALTVFVAVAAVSTFAFVFDAAGAAGDAQSRWGDPVPVIVTTTDLEVGDVVEPAHVADTEAPSGLVPTDAATTPPIGRVVRAPMASGEIVSQRRIGPDGATGLAALLDPDQRGIGVPRAGVDVPLRVGDHVDVLATLDPTAAPTDDPTLLLVQRALVIAVDEEVVTLAVSAFDATTVAHAVTTATVTLVLTG